MAEDGKERGEGNRGGKGEGGRRKDQLCPLYPSTLATLVLTEI